jgi:hypothetical protein
MPLTSRCREVDYDVTLIREDIKNGGKYVGRHLPCSPLGRPVLLLEQGVLQDVVHKVVFSCCVGVLVLLFGGTTEVDLRGPCGKYSEDAVPCLVYCETKLALMRSWRKTTEAECRAYSKCKYCLFFSNGHWNHLFAVLVLDVLGEEGMACVSVNYPCCINAVSIVVQHEDPIRMEERGGQVHDSTHLYLVRSPILRVHMGYW